MSDLFTSEYLESLDKNSLFSKGSVTVLGKTFANDGERREYFRNELRKKLPELKKLAGFPAGNDDDIINLSDPPFYTACPNPWTQDFVSEWEAQKKTLEAEGKRDAHFEVKEPYASDVSEGKNNPIYNAHSYHTKVPHPAIMRYILHYTEPGDIILDGFAGTGMTGVAASACGKCGIDLKNKIEAEFAANGYNPPVWGERHAVLGDLSPVASFIAYNYNTPVDAAVFESEAKKALAQVEEECGWMYETRHTDGTKGRINYVVWSDVFVCPDCGSEVVFFDAAVDKEKGEILDEFPCAACGAKHTKKQMKRAVKTVFDKALGKSVTQAKTVPVLISYTDKSGKRHEKKPDAEDFKLIEKIDATDIPYWFPTDVMCEGREAHRNDSAGITNVHQFYTKRNLWVLAALWDKLNFQERIILTNCLSRNATKLNRYVVNSHNPHGRINGPLTGTLYIPSETVEQNVFTLISEKSFIDLNIQNLVSVTSAEDSLLAQNSVDYIFTDPPFGANIMYSELNFLQESWLRVKTNNKEEAIENEAQHKGLTEYLNIMQKCFAEYFRVLKPGKWLTVEFSNTQSSVWNAIQLALNRTGFVIANVAVLDKQHGGIKSMTYSTAVKQDLVLSCYKPSETFAKNFLIQDSTANTWSFVEEQLEHLPIPAFKDEKTAAVVERSPKVLYDRLITYFLMRGLNVPLDASDFQDGLFARYVYEDGMVFTSEQASKYRELKKKHNVTGQMKLFVAVIESESDAIQWLREKLSEKPLKYQDIQPEYRKAYAIKRKGEVEVELKDVLEENFIKNPDEAWRVPDMNEQKDRDAMRTKALLKIWSDYCQQVDSGKVKKLKDVRLEAVKAGFKDCYQKKDFKRIVQIGEKIPENLLVEDETLLNYYDIACGKV